MSNPASIKTAKAYSARMRLIIDGISRAATQRAFKTFWVAPIVLTLLAYLRRVSIRFENILARIDARPPRPRGPSPPRPDRAKLTRSVKLPDDFGWLRWMAPEAAAFAAQLTSMLAEPELAAMLARAPDSGGLLRPVLWMLGETPGDLPPAIPRKPRSHGAPSASASASASASPNPGGMTLSPEFCPKAA